MTHQDAANREGPTARAFLDANVLYSAARGGGLLKLWDCPRVTLVTSEYALHEAWVNLESEIDPESCRNRLGELMSRVDLCPYAEGQLLFKAPRLLDRHDEPILQGAIEHNCQYLVAGDKKCFGNYYGQTFDGVTIFRPSDFLRLYSLDTEMDRSTDRP